MSDLTDLIARIEAATGSDRELDAEIGRYAPHLVQFLGCVPDDPQPGCLRHTDSIDAALTLVPNGMEWQVAKTHDRKGIANVWSDDDEHYVKAATPALALCAAALKARNA